MSDSIFFKHFRVHDEITRLDSKDRSLYNAKSGVTLAYFDTGDSVQYAIAYCSPLDRFNKKIGRDIALARLDTPEYRLKFHNTFEQFELRCKSVYEGKYTNYEELLDALNEELGYILYPMAYMSDEVFSTYS